MTTIEKPTTYQLNGSPLVREIRRLARRNPDRKAGCIYVEQDDLGNYHPVCIVGMALHNLGMVPDHALWFAVAFAHQVDSGKWQVSERYAAWISNVQQYQDMHKSWAQAVKAADDLSETPVW